MRRTSLGGPDRIMSTFLLLALLCVLNGVNGRRDWASEQLSDYGRNHEGNMDILRTAYGVPIVDKLNVLTVGPREPILLQDVVFLEEMAHFNRERIPERLVHAKGAGAFGTFEVTRDITRFTRANLFSEIGKKTDIAVRFSILSSETGSPDTVLGIRGFALKFYTEEGNWDLVGMNSPFSFIRDPMLMPSFVHSTMRNPVTHLKDADMKWDFRSLRPESTSWLLFMYSDRGLPDGYRHMDGYGGHAYKLLNAHNEPIYCKFHWKSNQGLRNLTVARARELQVSDPDYATRDLYNAIANGDYPSWTFYIQVMTFEQARTWRFNPFDITKPWPVDEFPLLEVGKFILTSNPSNYFAEVEQIAFSPAFMVPGIEPSPDKVLQGRLFAYSDAQRYRLGANYLQIPVNCPLRGNPMNYERDGQQTITTNQNGAPNYFPNSFNGPVESRWLRRPAIKTSGDIDRWNSTDEDNFTQAGIFYREELNEGERSRLVRNLAADLSGAKEFIQERALNNFRQADQDLGFRLRAELDNIRAQSALNQKGTMNLLKVQSIEM